MRISSPSELRPESGPQPLSQVLRVTSASALLLRRFFSSLSGEFLLKSILLRLSTRETFLRTRGSARENNSLSGISLGGTSQEGAERGWRNLPSLPPAAAAPLPHLPASLLPASNLTDRTVLVHVQQQGRVGGGRPDNKINIEL